MCGVYRWPEGDPFAVEVHPTADVDVSIRRDLVAVRYSHGLGLPVTVLLPAEAARNTMVALAIALGERNEPVQVTGGGVVRWR